MTENHINDLKCSQWRKVEGWERGREGEEKKGKNLINYKHIIINLPQTINISHLAAWTRVVSRAGCATSAQGSHLPSSQELAVAKARLEVQVQGWF